MSTPRTFTFRRRHRLAHANQFQAVYGGRVRKARGPLTIFALPNGLEHARLGLSIGRRCGPAVVRNAIKRRMREAFRSVIPKLPTSTAGGYDLAITAVAHEPRHPDEYAAIIEACAAELHREWSKRLDRRAREDGPA